MKRLFIAVICMAHAVGMGAQTMPSFIDRIIRQLRMFPQEKTYTHTDAADYAPGERIWLKVYVVDALSHEPKSESLYAYVELLSPNEKVVTQAKLLCTDGVFAGYLDIPSSAKAGQYLVRSYTELSRNARGYDSGTPIYIGGKDKKKTIKKKKREANYKDIGNSALHISRIADGLSVSTTMPGDSLTLLAHYRAYPFAITHISREHPVKFPSDSLPEGVISMLLLDNRLNILAERLTLSTNHREQCALDIVTDKEYYAPREPVTISLKAPDLHEGERADISISVTSTMLRQRHKPSSIIAHLMLGSDVKQGLFHPEPYMTDIRRADSLLNGEHWTRYNFGNVLHGQYASPEYRQETTHAIRGLVRTPFRHKPVVGANVSLISPEAGCLATTTTDEHGRFEIPGMDYPEGTRYVLRATYPDGKERVEITVIEHERPATTLMDGLQYDSEVIAETYYIENDSLPSDFDAGIMLENVDVKGKMRNSASEADTYALIADYSLGLQRIEEIDATCLHELFRRIPGVRVHNNRCYLRAAASNYDDTPAAIAIDGVIIPQEYDLDIIQMQDVARVDVFKTGTTVIWGSAGGNGVISVTLKEGSYRESDAKRINQQKISPLGYQLPQEFYYQQGRRKTLYWNPNVRTDTIELNAADMPGQCHIVVEGVTTEGRLIHQEHDINVAQ